MIDKKSLKKLLEILKYSTENGILYEKQYSEFGCSIYVDFSSQKIVYPEDKGFFHVISVLLLRELET